MAQAVSNVKHRSNVVAFATGRHHAPRFEWQARVLASSLRPATKVVAVALGDFFNEDKDFTAWPSQTTLAKLTNMSDRWVRAALAELVATGFLEEARTGGGLRRDENGFLRGRTTLYHMTNPEEPFRVNPEENSP